MDMLECIATRHSTRRFTDDAVPTKQLDSVIEAGRRAPSGGNMQPTHFIVITNRDVLKKLVTLVQEEYGKTEITDDLPAYIKNIIKLSREGKFVFNYGAPVLIVLAHKPSLANNFSDAACAMQNMMLAVNALGLGACWVNQLRHLQDNERIRRRLVELGMGDDEKVYASLALGVPAVPLNRRVLDIKGYPVTYVK